MRSLDGFPAQCKRILNCYANADDGVGVRKTDYGVRTCLQRSNSSFLRLLRPGANPGSSVFFHLFSLASSALDHSATSLPYSPIEVTFASVGSSYNYPTSSVRVPAQNVKN